MHPVRKITARSAVDALPSIKYGAAIEWTRVP